MHKLTIAALILITSAASARPPLVLKVTKTGYAEHSLTVENRGNKPVKWFWWSAVYVENGERRIYQDGSDEPIAPKQKVTLRVCDSCSNELPALTEVVLQDVAFTDGTRWFSPGNAKPPKDGAPMAVVPTKLTHRLRGDDCTGCATEKVWILQNTTKKPISAYNFHFKKPNGEESHMAHGGGYSVMPGQTVYVYVDGVITDFTSISFDDGPDWQPPSK
jgi:hypothetical protein